MPPAEDFKRPPALPSKRPAWLKSTRDWWRTLWASPMASVYIEADISALVRLARLKDAEERGKLPATGLTAMQQLEDRVGLSPKARRALAWEIGQAEQREQPARVPHLRVVDPRG